MCDKNENNCSICNETLESCECVFHCVNPHCPFEHTPEDIEWGVLSCETCRSNGDDEYYEAEYWASRTRQKIEDGIKNILKGVPHRFNASVSSKSDYWNINGKEIRLSDHRGGGKLDIIVRADEETQFLGIDVIFENIEQILTTLKNELEK